MAMGYVEGFVVAVPREKKAHYIAHAREAAAVLKAFGVARMVECWGDDVPDGTLTDFRRAVQAKPDEDVVLSWFEYPSKSVRDAAKERMMSDPRLADMMATMPFDGKRMIYGGFMPILDV